MEGEKEIEREKEIESERERHRERERDRESEKKKIEGRLNHRQEIETNRKNKGEKSGGKNKMLRKFQMC